MTTLLLITLCAAIAPLIGMRIRVPGVVLEIPDVAGKPLRLAVTGWLISLSLGLLIALAFEGFTMTTLVVGLCLTTTALGTILPIVRDAGLVKSPFGARVLAIGALGEFGPIVAMSLLLTTTARCTQPRCTQRFCSSASWCSRSGPEPSRSSPIRLPPLAS